VPPDAETDILIRRSFPTPDANSVASATSSFHFLVELLKILHWTLAFIDASTSGPAGHDIRPAAFDLAQAKEAGHDNCHGFGTRSVALIIALPLAA
jgi:hypothetical protein